ncbi:helix-turn-helix transcriptional regulator [Feifania hominis]|uniref:PAS domain-containing protein n=1 Tax=Feifania hominis TaxID=2763660 RepID=A0A926DDH3_9FIRM|nr:PAS domain-containing protein [Feifania hominis]MBC8535841.1 PAS domain-containing protein [Feifania hominis]
MKQGKLILTAVDRQVLASCSALLDGLAEYLGNGYEIVLHSLEDPSASVIKIVNGHHTGRQPGAPITDLALSMLDQLNESNGSTAISYFTRNQKGDPLKSTTIAIHGEHERIIGLLCINFYLNTSLSEFLSVFSPTAPTFDPAQITENFGKNANEMVALAVAQAQLQVDSLPSVLPSLKNREVISLLHERGIFNIKNAVPAVAEAMNISKNTVYLHLRHIREKK